MALTVVHINKQITAREADVRTLAAELMTKWEARDREEAQKILSKLKPGEILVNMSSKQGA